MIFHEIRFGQIFLTIKRSLAQCDVHRSDLSPILATEPFLLTNVTFFQQAGPYSILRCISSNFA